MQTTENTVVADGEFSRIRVHPTPLDFVRVLRQGQPSAPHLPKFAEHDDFDVTIIWQNISADSDFLCFRKESKGPVERILVDFAKVLQTGMFEEVISVNASKHLFCVTVVCTKSKDEGVMDAITNVL